MKAELRWLSGTPELFTIQSEGLIDEQDQPSDIPFGQPTHLAFPDHVHDFVALNRPPGSVEGPKPLAGVYPPFNRPVVLFDDVI